MRTIEQVLDVDAMRVEIADLGEQVAAPDLWDDQENATRVTGRLSALQGEVDRFAALSDRVDDLGIMVELGQEEGDADAIADAEKELERIKKAVEALEVRTLLSGEYDAREALVTIRSGAGGVDAADFAEMLMRMYVALGRAAQVPRRGLRHLLRRGGRPQVGHLRGPRAVRLRHAVGRGRHPPAGPDQPVRQPGPPADQLRRGRGRARARADRRDRDPRRGDPHRRLPLRRPRRPVGQHHRLRGPPHAHPDRHGRQLPEREEPAPEQGQRDGGAQGQAARAEEGRGEGAPRRAARRRAGVVGRPDAQLRAEPVPGGQGPAHRLRVGNPSAVFDGELDGFLEAGIRWRRGADKSADN